MDERILSIKEVDEAEGGYLITTTEQIIKILIANTASCCEQWGWIMTPDENIDYFIGAELKGMAIVDGERRKIMLEEYSWLDEGDALFVDVETSLGVLQFTLYNGHNGYYGHAVRIESKQLSLTDFL